MQILEQLASGYCTNNVTEQDIFMECANMLGYLEGCLQFSEVLTESAVMEGIDIKGMLKKALDFIRELIGKVRRLIGRLFGFFRKKTDKLKEQEVKEPSEDNTTSQNSSTSSNTQNTTADNTQKNQTFTQQQQTQTPPRNQPENPQNTTTDNTQQTHVKTKDEIIAEVFRSHPYKYYNPYAVWTAATNMSSFSKRFLDGFTKSLFKTCYGGVRIIIDKQKSGKDLDKGVETVASARDKIIEQGYVNYVVKVITSEMSAQDLYRGGNMTPRIQTPQDFAKIPVENYEFRRNDMQKGSKVAYDMGSFRNFVKYYNDALAEYSNCANSVSKNLKDVGTELADCEKDCSRLIKSIPNAPMSEENANELISTVTVAQECLVVCNQCLTYFSQGFVGMYAMMEQDLKAAEAYIELINNALPM